MTPQLKKFQKKDEIRGKKTWLWKEIFDFHNPSEVPRDTFGGVSGIFLWIAGWTGPIPFLAEISSWAGSTRKIVFHNLSWACSSRFQIVEQSACGLSRPNFFCCQVEPAQPKLISRGPRNLGWVSWTQTHYCNKFEVSRSNCISFCTHSCWVDWTWPESFDVSESEFGSRRFKSNSGSFIKVECQWTW